MEKKDYKWIKIQKTRKEQFDWGITVKSLSGYQLINKYNAKNNPFILIIFCYREVVDNCLLMLLEKGDQDLAQLLKAQSKEMIDFQTLKLYWKQVCLSAFA